VNVTADLETPRPADGEAFSDAVTIAFGDPRANVYGLARAGLAGGEASGLALLFRDGQSVAMRAENAPAANGGWETASLRSRVVDPLSSWTVEFDGGAEGGFTLELESRGAPAVIAPDSPAGEAGGMAGYEHLCRVTGVVRAGGEEIAVDCLGQRGHLWGSPDWDGMALARTLGAWIGDDLGVVLSAVRPAKGREHDAERVTAVVLEGDPVEAHPVADPRLSTTYDAEHRQRSAGLELWPPGENPYPRRGAGDVVCGTSLDLGRLRLDCAFFRWRMEGREGVGRYDVLRRAS
jgi:hypothetical protein